MRFNRLSGIFFSILLVSSCVNPPENFPSIPSITFESLEYVPTSGPDSLIIGIDFQDAEGDLGLSATDINPPFNALEYQRNVAGNLITYSTRPPEAPSYNPIDWVIDPIINNQVVKDTIWVKQNPNQYNIFVKFFIKRNGQFTEFRWEDPPFYTTFNGRFPRILTTDDGQAVEGNIKYAMLSSGWESIFRNDTIRIDIQIQDRQLNRSNEVSSDQVTLRQITRNNP
ncbi:hypothetical protein E4S40_01210 [Algoriphagus kandeliae]|uniref:Uncharacterized protein n=1 Tax=Algoriphagus kandeliae TaxID=2562278 RepID=A0A4Y9R271_9BACT|nr:hypothetical protein [Algoriphagus kandeliae]TFV97305.1 hypothetical protein E4S40_01210 [Algoriphagus kandeliae]